MTLAYFDCFSGASGDMILGALLDVGVDPALINDTLARLDIPRTRVRAESVQRDGLRGTKAHVECSVEEHTHRHFSDIHALIKAAGIDDAVKRDALAVFQRLAEAEGRVHGRPAKDVAFHEVGALDSIADIVGAIAGLHALGVSDIHVGPFSIGSGTIRCAHGTLPVPVPATAELLKGFATVRSGVEGELVTPTGAAILTTLGTQTPPPPFAGTAVGYGAGTADRPDLPNLLRLTLGEAPPPGQATDADCIWVLETTIDDMAGEICGYLFERLIDAGALDVTVEPVQMKKSRPGVRITCLAPVGLERALGEIILRETTTFGLRKTLAQREKLYPDTRTVATPLGEARVKIGRLGDEVVTIAPEYEDCRRLALESHLPLRKVYDMVLRAARDAGR